jgi:hypothetical protein
MTPKRSNLGLLIALSIADLCCIPLALLALPLAAMGTDGPDQFHPAMAAWLAKLCMALAVLGPLVALTAQRAKPGYGWCATVPALLLLLACWFNLLITD